ncbi:MAG: SRPBCC family protein [Gammaproteobacteria bacterium]
MFTLELPKSVAGEAVVKIDRPIDVVFDYVAIRFFEHYTLWALEVVEFKPINDNPMAVGALARQTRIDQGQKFDSTFEISELKPNEALVIDGLSAPYRNSYGFRPVHKGAGTLLTYTFELLELELFMRPFEKLIRRAIEEGARTTAQNIRGLLEDNPARG